MKIIRSYEPGDRYRFDLDHCYCARGWARVDTVNGPGFTGGQNSRRTARYGTDIKEEDLEAIFT